LLYGCRSVNFTEIEIAGHDLHAAGVHLNNHWSLFEISPGKKDTFILGCTMLQGGGSTPPQLTPHTLPPKAKQALHPVICFLPLHQTHQTLPSLLLLSAVTALSLVPWWSLSVALATIQQKRAMLKQLQRQVKHSKIPETAEAASLKLTPPQL